MCVHACVSGCCARVYRSAQRWEKRFSLLSFDFHFVFSLFPTRARARARPSGRGYTHTGGPNSNDHGGGRRRRRRRRAERSNENARGTRRIEPFPSFIELFIEDSGGGEGDPTEEVL